MSSCSKKSAQSSNHPQHLSRNAFQKNLLLMIRCHHYPTETKTSQLSNFDAFIYTSTSSASSNGGCMSVQPAGIVSEKLHKNRANYATGSNTGTTWEIIIGAPRFGGETHLEKPPKKSRKKKIESYKSLFWAWFHPIKSTILWDLWLRWWSRSEALRNE